MEAALASLFSAGDRVVVVAGGKFGARWVEIAVAYGLEVIELTVSPGQLVAPADVAVMVEHSAPVRGLFLTASETSTGTICDVRAIVDAVRYTFFDLKLVVEPSGALGIAALLSGAISAAGRVGILISGGNIDAQVMTSCLN